MIFGVDVSEECFTSTKVYRQLFVIILLNDGGQIRQFTPLSDGKEVLVKLNNVIASSLVQVFPCGLFLAKPS